MPETRKNPTWRECLMALGLDGKAITESVISNVTLGTYIHDTLTTEQLKTMAEAVMYFEAMIAASLLFNDTPHAGLLELRLEHETSNMKQVVASLLVGKGLI